MNPILYLLRGSTLFLLATSIPILAEPLPPAVELKQPGTLLVPAEWQARMLERAKKMDPAEGAVERTDLGIKLITRQQPEFLYSLQGQLRTTGPVKKDDAMLIRFAARSLKADKLVGSTKIGVSFNRVAQGSTASYRGEVGVTSGWVWYDIPFSSKHDSAAGEAVLSFNFGYPPQEIEIAGLQVVGFGNTIKPADLPRTRRQTPPTDPARLEEEFTRIDRMRREYDAVSNPAPANGRTLHVTKQGTNKGDGGADKPFASIPQALRVVKPGDTILVAAGEYIEPAGITIRTSGEPDAWIRIMAAPGARPKINSSGWMGIGTAAATCYVEIRGFELEGRKDPRRNIEAAGIGMVYASHHIRVVDNVVHGFGVNGIMSLDCDYLHVEGNVVYNNAKTSPYGGSGISLCRAFNFDDHPGYHNVVRGNVCYDNENLVVTAPNSGGNGKVHTDGNGIIIDVFDRSRANPRKVHTQDRDGPLEPYLHRTLVENNLVYHNGGRGVHVFRSSKVDVVNNTSWMNQRTRDINAGELTAIESNGIVFVNNIAYGRPEKRANSEDGSRNVIWNHNLVFNSQDILHHDGVLVADPLFTDPSPTAGPEGFRLASNSPALGRAVALPAPSIDLAGVPRPKNDRVDLGAYQISK